MSTALRLPHCTSQRSGPPRVHPQAWGEVEQAVNLRENSIFQVPWSNVLNVWIVKSSLALSIPATYSDFAFSCLSAMLNTAAKEIPLNNRPRFGIYNPGPARKSQAHGGDREGQHLSDKKPNKQSERHKKFNKDPKLACWHVFWYVKLQLVDHKGDHYSGTTRRNDPKLPTPRRAARATRPYHPQCAGGVLGKSAYFRKAALEMKMWRWDILASLTNILFFPYALNVTYCWSTQDTFERQNKSTYDHTT